jgi:protein arginine kinase activator
MSQSVKCSLCQEVATVHLSQVIHGKVTKVHLCESCAQKGGASDPSIFQLAEALAAPPVEAKVVCPQCGFTDQDFRKKGRLGCPACWQVFGDSLQLLLTKVQFKPVHVGRLPAGFLPLERWRQRLVAARTEMSEAVAQEDYEAAARLRDEISELETRLK